MTINDSVPGRVLIVEDSAADIELTRRAFEKSGHDVRVHAVRTGQDCLDWLRGGPGLDEDMRPHLILLDLNMPGMTGHEVLREIKSDDNLRSIPVVILTTSDQRDDVERCYDAHCNSYVTKPIGLQPLQELIDELNTYWFDVVRLPTAS